MPVVLLLLLAIADMGRLYTSAVAVEAAGREAADYGAYDVGQWDPGLGSNIANTVAEMKIRACTAAQGSHLEGYAQSDPSDVKSCTNPSMICTLEHGSAAEDCDTTDGAVDGVNCWDPLTEPPCTVHVRMDYEFRTFLSFPPMPESIAIVRNSLFRLSNLKPATP